jgi:predicted Zn-dependent protease
MMNAFALPGGFVVLFRGLIDAAESPDEVAAVLAHEIGHVVSRDPTRHALRSAGSIGVLGLLFGDFAGGAVVLFLTERLIDAQYSQGAESGADRFAYGVLLNAGASPAALGDMFQRLRDKYGDSDAIIAHFLSHPGLEERIKAARAAAPKDRDYQPILGDEEWAALKGICTK